MPVVALGVSVLFCGLATALAVRSARMISRANPGIRWPIWRGDPGFQRPATAIWVRAGASSLAAIGAAAALPAVGSPALLLLLPCVSLPEPVVALLHNRALRRREVGTELARPRP